MKLGHLAKVQNLDRRFGAHRAYHGVLVVDEKGQFETLMLTDADLKRSRERAAKNPEDEIQPTWKDKLLR